EREIQGFVGFEIVDRTHATRAELARFVPLALSGVTHRPAALVNEVSHQADPADVAQGLGRARIAIGRLARDRARGEAPPEEIKDRAEDREGDADARIERRGDTNDVEIAGADKDGQSEPDPAE